MNFNLNPVLNPVTTCPFYKEYCQNFYYKPFKYTKAQIDIMNEFRMLWEQHGFWTRSAIVSMVLGLPDEELVVNRLLRNPTDFERVLTTYYGARIASYFSNLLKSHLTIAAQLVKASKSGNSEAAKKAEIEWYANAEEIAVLLGTINPYWTKEGWKDMLNRHLALVKAEAVDMLTKDYAAGIAIFEDIEKQALEMADMMSTGIIKQFPYKFK